MHNLQLGVRGATQRLSPTRYALSAAAFRPGGHRRRLGPAPPVVARSTSTSRSADASQFGGSFSVSQARSKATPTAGQQNANAGAVSAALQYVPVLPIRRADGTYSLINTDLNVYNALLDAPQTPNPVSLAQEVRDSLSDTRLLGNVFGQAELLPDLKLKIAVGADYADRWRNTYYPRTTLRGAQSHGEAIRATAVTARG